MKKLLLLFPTVSLALAQIPGTLTVTAPIAPPATNSPFAATETRWQKGGFGTWATNYSQITNVDWLPMARREAGMRMYVNGITYSLGSDLTTWTVDSTSGVTGSGTANTIPLWTGSSVLGDSAIRQDGGTIYTDTARNLLFGPIAQLRQTNPLGSQYLQLSRAQNGIANGIQWGVNNATANVFTTTNRWQLVSNATPESGANVGSDLDLVSYSDDAITAATVFRAKRSTGIIDFLHTPTVAGVALGSGTVTSVAASVPSFLSIAGSPITSSGTLTFTLSGTALPVTSGGLGATTFTDGGVLIGNATGAIQATSAGTSGQVLTSNGAGVDPTFQTLAAGGTVTSVAASVPSFLSISGSPVTTSGTLAISYSGTALPVANGGSGATTLTGYLKGNGTSAFTASATIPTTDLSGTLAAAQFPALTGDTTTSAGSLATTTSRLNGISLAGLATGILKNTTGTGVPSIAIAGDFPTLNQNTTGSAATLTTARNLYGFSFNGSAATVSGTDIIASGFGGTGNGFTKFTGPASTEKTFTLPNATATILTDNAKVTLAQGGTGQDLSGGLNLPYVLVRPAAQSYNTSSAETDILSTSGYSVPAGTLGTDGQFLDIDLPALVKNNSGGTSTWRLRIYLAGTLIYDDTSGTLADNANTRPFPLRLRIYRVTSTTASILGSVLLSPSGAATVGFGDISTTGSSYPFAATGAACTWSSANTVRVTLTFSVSNALTIYTGLPPSIEVH
jgi:hypothetical protein